MGCCRLVDFDASESIAAPASSVMSEGGAVIHSLARSWLAWDGADVEVVAGDC